MANVCNVLDKMVAPKFYYALLLYQMLDVNILILVFFFSNFNV